jgi:hypothetical protein
MADEDWHKVDRPATPPRQSTPGERIWSLRRNGRQVDCERLHGGSHGWECQCLYDGELLYGRRFVMRELALDEAEAQRPRLKAEGWLAPS